MRQVGGLTAFICLAFAAASLGSRPLRAQTTQGLISGRILNSVTGKPIAGSEISYSSAALSAAGAVKSDAAGYFFLPLLSAGTYTIRAEADTYQAQELQQLELAVAGRADAIVTHNVRHFAGAERFGVRVMTPREFLRTIGGEGI